jgi:hypothetical protein
MKMIGFAAFVLSLSSMFLAQPKTHTPSPEFAFVKICSLYGSANQGASAWNKDEACDLPAGFNLDKSFHQTSFSCCGGGATSNIGINDIPAGIRVDVSGGYYWSVGKPIELIRFDDDGPIKRQFRIHTYCGPAGSPGPGCNVKVDVYAAQKP